MNGKFAIEDEATIPIKDQGFKYGDGVLILQGHLDTRYLGLKEHLERSERTLKYMDLDPAIVWRTFKPLRRSLIATYRFRRKGRLQGYTEGNEGYQMTTKQPGPIGLMLR